MAENENTTAQEEQPKTVVEELKEKFGDAVLVERAFRGDLTVRVAPGDVVRVMTFLKNFRNPAFNMLTDLCGADYPDRENRFDVVYHLCAMDSVERLRVKTSVPEGDEVPTLTGLWKSANWQEREVYDMFGVRFSGHPNMTRILMWEGYDGWPLRKDFPLKGNRTMDERYHEKDIRRTRQYKQYCWEGYCTDL